MNKPIDIFITAYERAEQTLKTIEYLYERTTYPFRLFLIDNGGNTWVSMRVEQEHADTFHYINLGENMGIHAAWNMALALAESDYFITTDNDIYVPDVRRLTTSGIDTPPTCWLTRLVGFMGERPDYGAISLHPHVFIGAAGIDPSDPEDVKERNMCGAVMRIMRTEAVRKAGGWEHVIEAGRNHEERTICSRLQSIGYKVGITSRIRAFHPFPPNWGYPPEFTPEMQKHTPELEPYVQQFGNMDAYDNNTWLPK